MDMNRVRPDAEDRRILAALAIVLLIVPLAALILGLSWRLFVTFAGV